MFTGPLDILTSQLFALTLYFCKVHFYVILTSGLRSPKWSHTFGNLFILKKCEIVFRYPYKTVDHISLL